MTFSLSAAANSNQYLVYQGRVVRPDGTVPNTGSLTFTLSVYSPSPSKCLLYSETQIVSMVGSQGMFSLQLGAGSRVDGGSHTFNQVFTNGATLSGLTCADGSTSYTAGATDDRSLAVSFNDAGTVVNLSAMAIKSVPFALQAHEVDGWGLNNLVKVSSIGSPSTFTTSEMANVKSVGAAACATNEILKWNGSAWMCSSDATGGSPGDAGYTGSKGIVAFDTDAATSGITVASGLASVNAGTGANQIVKLDASSKLPAVDGSALTNLNSNNIASGTLPIARGGTGASTKTAAFDALSPLTTKGDVIVFDGTNNIRLPAGSDGQVLTADSAQASGVKWTAASAGSVTSVTAGTGLSGGTITTTGTLSVNAGTGANQIVQLDASSKLPAVDGSALTNLSTTQITSGTLPVSRGGTGAVSFAANNLVGTNGTGTALQAVTCTQNQIISFDASGNYGCYNLSSIAGSTYFAQNGNSFGAAAVLGTRDSSSLSFETNNSTRVTISATGNVGIGTMAPIAPLDVKGEIRMTGDTSGYAGFKSPAVGPSVTWTLPNSDGSAGQLLETDGSGNLSWTTVASSASAFVNGGNSFAGAATLGTNDNNELDFETIGTTRMTLDTSGNLALSFPGFGQGMTSKLPTNAYASLGRLNSSSGGLSLIGVSKGTDKEPLIISGYFDDTDPDNQIPAITLRAGRKSGTGVTSIGSSKTAFQIQNNSTNLMTVLGSGNVGIGTASPTDSLQVTGTIRNTASIDNAAGTSIDWSKGNTQYTSAGCTGTQYTFSNMRDGGAYKLVITGTFTSNCTFGQTSPDTLSGTPGSGNFYFLPANAVPGGSNSMYSFTRVGSNVYVQWSSGFQN